MSNHETRKFAATDESLAAHEDRYNALLTPEMRARLNAEHYDEKYDMDVLHDWWYSGGVAGNVIIAKGMREPGVEPGYLAVPDPKSRLHTAIGPSSPPAQDQGTAQSRPSPVGADETTTNSTTDFERCVRCTGAGRLFCERDGICWGDV